MVSKIQNGDYLKRFSNMTIAEQQAYLKNVAEWLDKRTILTRCAEDSNARFLTAEKCSVSWSDSECKMWEDGVRLMTAFIGTDAGRMLPKSVYTDSAKETIRWMIRELQNIQRSKETIQTPEPIKPVEQPATNTEHRKPGRPRKAEKQTDNLPNAGCATNRPKHIDQYVHLLPKKTQERASLVKDLLQREEVARENARLLMNDENASPAELAKWSSLATKCDNEVRSIYRELDEEWDKLVKSGRVIVDDLGNARVVDNGESSTTTETAVATEPSSDVQDIAAKRRSLRKWLVDTRRGNGDTRDEHVKKWKESYKEYLQIESSAAKDKKIVAAAKHYGINIAALETKNEK